MAEFLFKFHSAPEIELSEVSLHENPLLEKAASSPPCHTWLIFLKRELEFLGVSEHLPTSTRVGLALGKCTWVHGHSFPTWIHEAGEPW